MLTRLHIRQFAIVEDLELAFGPGMTVLTGETGAGKSILLDALGLVLGDRADSAVVRPGAKRAEITAEFDVSALEGVAAWLAERELDADGECLVRRTVNAEGGSRGYVNGQPMPVQALKELGEQLVDIHGQHAHQSLLKRAVQRQFLDDFADHAPLLEETAGAYRRWRELHDEYERLAGAAGDRGARRDLLRYQVAELRELGLQPGEVAELEAEHRRLANASRLLEGAQQAAAVLSEGEEQTVSHLLAQTLSDLQGLAELDPRLQTAAQLLGEAEIQVREAGSELRHYLADLELDPERLEYLESRLATLQDLARKHQARPEELPERLEALAAELAELEGADDRLAGLEAEIRETETVYRNKAEALGKGRRK
ncbi:MAG TPA: AAA family ATPase, partial [Gammaproteobacteria bacterium]|nr:AAA family ATPase [Gammaproteobacteria bacterium]